MKNISLTDQSYFPFLKEIKHAVMHARAKASYSVNRELIKLYWELGQKIVDSQKQYGWGKAIVERLSKDLRDSFPGNSGFSTQNLWYMRQFYLEYKETPDLQQLVGEIPWGHNLMIMSKVKDAEAKRYYLKTTLQFGWSRNVLNLQIQNDAYKHHTLTQKQHNFKAVLSEPLATQADQTMKDVYTLDFLGITKPVVELEIERRMIEKIKDVLLELGYGFSFIANQYRLQLGGNDYYVDLLLYNRKLNALVAIELKAGKFKPEYAGKMNFYLNLLDEKVRERSENPSIGIIMCSERNHLEVEYALRGIQKPVGIAEFKLTKTLPKELSDKLPDAKQLEKQILKEISYEEV